MSGLVLTLREPLSERLDASSLAPDRLASLPLSEISRLHLRFESGRPAAVADLFEASGEPSDTLRLVGDLSQVDGIGARTASGSLIVEGDAGRRLGTRMTGGSIELTGAAGDDTGLEMAGGRIVVRGSVGRRTGSAPPGARRGMTGGEIIIFGDAGADTGACLRRGTIAVAGDCEPDALRGAIAGTVLVAGTVAGPTGRWSKRGSLIALDDVPIPPTYRYACTFRPPHVALLLTHLRHEYGFPVLDRYTAGLYRRFSGDVAEGGRGEILQWTAE